MENLKEETFRTIARKKKIRPYSIPFRCLYSRNIDNLMMAGRNISVTHVALGTVRVMKTTGMMGEVVGLTASLCNKMNRKLKKCAFFQNRSRTIAQHGLYTALAKPRWGWRQIFLAHYAGYLSVFPVFKLSRLTTMNTERTQLLRFKAPQLPAGWPEKLYIARARWQQLYKRLKWETPFLMISQKIKIKGL